MERELSHRPLVVAAVGLILGLLALEQPIVLLVALGLTLFLRDIRSRLVAAGAFVIGALIAPPVHQPLMERVWVDEEASVASVPRLYPQHTTCELGFQRWRLLASLPKDTRLTVGDRVRLRGVARPFREGAEGNYVRRGVVGRIRPVSIEVAKPGPYLFRIGSAWRDSFVSFCERTMPSRCASAVEAICFNVDTALDPDDRDALRRSGTVHIVSASGLHVAIFAGFLALALSALPIPRQAQIVALVLVLVAYAAATGLRAPIVRSVLMVGAILPAYLLKRESDLLSALAAAACVQLLWQPTDVYDIGFQLSFLIVGALVLFGSPRELLESRPLPRFFEQAKQHARQGLIATVAAAPVVAHYFGMLSLTSLPANALMALALPFIVVLAIAAHAVSFLLPALGIGVMIGVVSPLTGWVYWVLDALGGEWAALDVPHFDAIWLAPFYMASLMVWRTNVRSA